MISFEEAKGVTLRAYELGINYFDTARIYWDGKSEEVYGEVLFQRPREGARKPIGNRVEANHTKRHPPRGNRGDRAWRACVNMGLK